MRKELKRCNFLGSASSLHYLAGVAVVEYPTRIDAVKSICALNNSLNINSLAALYFFEELGLITIDATDSIISSDYGRTFLNCTEEVFIEKLSAAVFLYLIENGMINFESVSYDPNTRLCHIRRAGFPLSSAVFRNLLIDLNAMHEVTPGLYQVNELYESLFESSIRKQMPRLTLEDLMEKQRRQEEQGRLAEEFVVAYEKHRLGDCDNKEEVKQISDLDVTAGYDIISFESSLSTLYDRFIEVKSFHSRPSFFWSSNEYETAKKLGGKYHLYLVDMDRYLKTGYQPIIIPNPAVLFDSETDWIIEPASWKITKI